MDTKRLRHGFAKKNTVRNVRFCSQLPSLCGLGLGLEIQKSVPSQLESDTQQPNTILQVMGVTLGLFPVKYLPCGSHVRKDIAHVQTQADILACSGYAIYIHAFPSLPPFFGKG